MAYARPTVEEVPFPGDRASVEALIRQAQEYRRKLHPCKHPNAEYLGSISGAGEPATKRYGCPDCGERYQVQEEQGAEEPPCPHESWEVGSQWRDKGTDKWWKSRRCADCREYLDNVLDDEPHEFEGSPEAKTSPPQPERRPPYAVAYSAGGHAYEVLLPGDARVEAVDGRLIIEHPGLQVLGIMRVQPVRTENSDG
jgi:hypothetical protein